MPYAITLCFDETTEELIVKTKREVAQALNIKMQAADFYPPHVTLAIFDALSLNSTINIDDCAAQARKVPFEFCGLGLFESPNGYVVFLTVAPSRKLIDFHEALHLRFESEKRRDAFYDVGKWLPHCTIATKVEAAVTVGSLFRLLPKELLCRRLSVNRMELVFATDIVQGPMEIMHSIPLSF